MDASFARTMTEAAFTARDLAHECASRCDAEGAHFWIAMMRRFEDDCITHRGSRRIRSAREYELTPAE